MKFNKFFYSVGLLSALNGYAVQLSYDCNGDDSFTITGQNMKQHKDTFQVNVYVDGEFIDDINSNNQSFSYTLSPKKYHKGDTLKIQINQYNKDGSHFVETKSIDCGTTSSGGGSSGNSGGSSSGNSGGSTTQPDQSISAAEITKYADQQARTVANRVKNIYGKLEAWKRSFVRGFWLGYDSYQTNPFKYLESQEGERIGMSEGQSSGLNAGVETARSQALDLAKADARQRFVSIVDSGSSPDTSVRIPVVTYAGASSSISRVDMSDVWSELDSQLQAELRNLAFRDGDAYLTYNIWSGTFTIENVYGYGGSDKYSLVDSWFRDDNAWDEWKNNRLNGRYDYNLYEDKMDFSDQQQFQSEFKRIYNNVINEKMYEIRNMTSEESYGRGMIYGQLAGQKLAYKSGYVRGYSQSYKASSIQGFRETFDGAYQSNFLSQVDYYNGNVVVVDLRAELADDNANSVYEIGESIGINVTNLVNIGRQTLVLTRPVLSGNAIDSLGSSESLEIEGSSSLKGTHEFKGVAKIRANAPSDENIGVRASFNNGSIVVEKPLAFTLSLVRMVVQFGNSETVDAKMQAYIVAELKKELDQAVAAKSTTFPKLTQVISAVNQVSHRANFSSVKAELLGHAAKIDVSGWMNKSKKVKQAFEVQVNKL